MDSVGVCRSATAGLPHSEIAGSMRVCRSPTLIAACHVLHRLSAPRHPSCALSSLTTKKSIPSSGLQTSDHLDSRPCDTSARAPQQRHRLPDGIQLLLTGFPLVNTRYLAVPHARRSETSRLRVFIRFDRAPGAGHRIHGQLLLPMRLSKNSRCYSCLTRKLPAIHRRQEDRKVLMQPFPIYTVGLATTGGGSCEMSNGGCIWI